MLNSRISRRTFIRRAAATVSVAFLAPTSDTLSQWLGLIEAKSPRTPSSDICIIGSGIVGSIMAEAFAQKGFSVTVLEAGPNTDQTNSRRDAFIAVGEKSYPLNRKRSRRVGGSSHCWAGISPRFHPDDFKTRTLYGIGEDWPVSYQQLEPYLVRAEQALGVCGEDDGSLAPPRSAGYPMPPPRFPDLVRVEGVFRKAGIETCALAKAVTSRPYDGRGKSVLYRADQVHLQRALKTGRVKLETDAVVRRLEMDNRGNIRRVVFQGIERPEQALESSLFILACGGVENARVLLLSANSRFPRGLANWSGQVGMRFMDHPSVRFVTAMNKRFSFSDYALHSFQWYDRSRRKDRLGMLMEAYGFPNMDHIVKSGGRREEAGMHMTLAMMVEQLPDPGNFIDLDLNAKDLFGDAVPRIHYRHDSGATGAGLREAEKILKGVVASLGGGVSEPTRTNNWGNAHHMGTCRMGNDSRDSVVNPFLQCHEVPNLYVAGTSSFVTGGAANPTLTAVALALRTTDRIIQLRGRAALPMREFARV